MKNLKLLAFALILSFAFSPVTFAKHPVKKKDPNCRFVTVRDSKGGRTTYYICD